MCIRNPVTMEDRLNFKDLKSERGDAVIDWDYELIQDDARCYYKRVRYDESNPDEQVGFEFYIVYITGRLCREDSIDDYFHPENDVEVLYNGIAYFDGIRHLYMGDKQTDNYGYDYYADLELHIKALQVLRKLEVKHCRDLD